MEVNTSIKGNIELIEACLKTATGWGSNTITNICNDSVTIIQWGVLDYFGWVFVCSLMILITIVLSTMLISTLRY